MNELQSVASVKVKTGFVLEITFEDGKSFALDFKPWIDPESGWLFDPIKDQTYFAKVFVHGGALEWPNGLDIRADGLRTWCERGGVPPIEYDAEDIEEDNRISDALCRQHGLRR
jgi:hypothetical protein